MNLFHRQMWDFTLRKYMDLCEALLNDNYSFVTVSEFIRNKPQKENYETKVAIIRHDVDRWIYNSINMAVAEKNLGIKTTFYFRYPGTFFPSMIKQINSYGHETGYHYEVLSKTKGELQEAWELFNEELQKFREIVPVQTVSMHGAPLSSFDSRDLWRYCSPADAGLLGEAYAIGDDVIYLNDTGRRWDGRYNMRDHIPGHQNGVRNLTSTDDLIAYIRKEEPSFLYLNIHPERWNDSLMRFGLSYLMDISFNFGKIIIQCLKGLKW